MVFRNVSLTFPGGGTRNLTSIEPPHWANEYEPWRYCPRDYCPGGLSTPSYGWFIRHVVGLTLDQVRVAYGAGSPEARPAFVVEDARNVSILGAAAQRGMGLGYDIGLRRTPPSEVLAPGMVMKPLMD